MRRVSLADRFARDREEPREEEPSGRLQGWVTGLFLLWIWAYMNQGMDGFFARTIERVDAWWIKAVFLNIPGQLVLGAIMSVCLGARRAGVRRVGCGIGLLLAVLIVGHVALSIWTA